MSISAWGHLPLKTSIHNAGAMCNPMVMHYFSAAGSLGRQRISVPTLNASAILLTSLGADQLVIPVPGDLDKKSVKNALSALPKSRQRVIRLVDANGKILQRVRNYLQPLAEQAKKWPEDAFIDSAFDMVYSLALGSKYKAEVVDGGMLTVQEFLPIIHASAFHGEALHRLAEIAFLATRYEPILHPRAAVAGQVTDLDIRECFWKILESTEFAAVTSATGRLGYLRHPKVALRWLKRATSDLVSRRDFRMAIKAASAASTLASLPVPRSSIEALGETLGENRRFSPLFMDIPPALYLDVYTFSLREFDPRARPWPGSIFVFEHMKGGLSGHSWLNKGEEAKLKYNPREDFRQMQRTAVGAKEAGARILSHRRLGGRT